MSRHATLLGVVAVMALALLGAAYTLWYEDLELHADVTTGTFDIDWSCEDGDANTDPNNDSCGGAAHAVVSSNASQTFHTADELANLVPRVAEKMPTCDIAISTDQGTANDPAANDAASNNVMQLTLGNMYPYAGCEFWIDIHNAGTVPAHFTLTALGTAEGPTANPFVASVVNQPVDWTVLITNPTDTAEQQAEAAICAETLGAIAPNGGGLPSVQLHEDDEIVCHFIIYLDQVADEGWTYKFWATFTAHQWNEELPN